MLFLGLCAGASDRSEHTSIMRHGRAGNSGGSTDLQRQEPIGGITYQEHNGGRGPASIRVRGRLPSQDDGEQGAGAHTLRCMAGEGQGAVAGDRPNTTKVGTC